MSFYAAARNKHAYSLRNLNDSYPTVRQILAPEYYDLPPEAIDTLLRQTLGEDVSAEEIEGFLNTLKQVGRSAVQALPSVLPAAGTIVGTAIAGPAGGMLGGMAGQVAGQAVGAATQRQSQPPQRSGNRSRHRSRPAVGAGQQPPAQPSLPSTQGSPAAAQLMQVLANPQVQQALMAMMMGSAGRPNVRIAGTSVPVEAVGNAIHSLVESAIAEHHALCKGMGETIPQYLLDDAGEFLVDPANPDARAAILVELIAADNEALVPVRPADPMSDAAALKQALRYRAAELYQEEQEWLDQIETDAVYDELELAELYADDEFEEED